MKKYSFDELKQIALMYSKRSEFKKNNGGAYKSARNQNCLDIICSHMVQIKHKWNYDTVKKIAMQYDNRMSFKNNNHGAYSFAVKRGILDKVCSHMKKIGNEYYRCIYAYEFIEYNVCYIGLTYDLKSRDLQHRNKKMYSSVRIFSESMNIEIPKPIQLTEYIDKNIASKKEKYFVQLYKEKKWKVLNKATAGGLGGKKFKTNFSMENLKNIALNYTKISDFAKNHVTAYKLIRINHWHEYVFNHIDKEKNKKHTSNIPIVMINIDTNEQYEYSSISECEKQNHISHIIIKECCKGKREFYKNKKFSYIII